MPTVCTAQSLPTPALILPCLTGGVAVEGKEVGGSAREVAESTRCSQGADAVAQGLGAREALQAGKVRTKASDVRGRHGSTGLGALEDVSIFLQLRVSECNLTLPPPGRVERMLLPGANMSTTLP